MQSDGKISQRETYTLKLLNKLNRKFGRFGIQNLILYIIIGQGLVFACNYLMPEVSLLNYMNFDRDLIFSGQWWRIISFIFIPPASSPIWIIFALYFYYLIGTAIESSWGSFNFTVYYLLGVIGTIISGFISGYAENFYLNLSLFLGFAVLFPDYEFLVFFILRVKAKYMAYLDAAFLLYSLIFVSWSYKGAIIVAFVNFILFFSGGFFTKISNHFKYRSVRRNFKIQMHEHKDD